MAGTLKYRSPRYCVALWIAATAADRALKSPAERVTLTDTDVARRAYDLYLARGCAHGHDVDDWLQAEQQLRAGSTTT
jgi:hypothetical protein